MPVSVGTAHHGSPMANGSAPPGSTLEKQLLSIEAAKRAKAAGEPLPAYAAKPNRTVHHIVHRTPPANQQQRTPSPPAPPPLLQAEQPASAPVAAPAPAPADAVATPVANGTTPPAPDGASPEAEGTPTPERKAAQAREDELLEQAAAIKAKRAQLALAYGKPWADPPQPASHWSLVLQEATWLAVDFCQERLWKRYAARSIAFAAAAARRAKTLKSTPAPEERCGDQLGKVVGEPGLERSDSGRRGPPSRPSSRNARSAAKAAKDRAAATPAKAATSASAATPSAEQDVFAGIDSDDDLAPRTPPGAESMPLCYGADAAAAVPGLLDQLEEQFLACTVESRMAIQEWDEDYVAAKDERDEAIRRAAPDPLRSDFAPLPDLDGGLTEPSGGGRRASGSSRRQKRQRIVYDDDDWDTEEPPQLRQRPMPPPRRIIHAADGTVVGTRQSERQAGRKRRLESRDDPETDYEPSGSRRPMRRSVLSPGRMGRDRRPIGRRGEMAGRLGWSVQEDELLAAVVHEFGDNWLLVADVLSSSGVLSGLFRSAQSCRGRFREMEVMSREDPQPESGQILAQMNKHTARTLLGIALPVPDRLLKRSHAILCDVGMKARERRLLQQKQLHAASRTRDEAHPSHPIVIQRILANSGGQQLNPLQILAASSLGNGSSLMFPAMAGPAGMPPIAASAGVPPGMAHMQSAGSGQMSATAGGGAQPGMPQAANPGMARPQRQRQGVSSSDLQRFLQTGRAPNGQPLTDTQRQQIVTQLQKRSREMQARLQTMLHHGTPQERAHAQQVLANQAAARQAQQAAAAAAAAAAAGQPAAQQPQQPPATSAAALPNGLSPPGQAPAAAGAPMPAGQQPPLGSAAAASGPPPIAAPGPQQLGMLPIPQPQLQGTQLPPGSAATVASAAQQQAAALAHQRQRQMQPGLPPASGPGPRPGPAPMPAPAGVAQPPHPGAASQAALQPAAMRPPPQQAQHGAWPPAPPQPGQQQARPQA